MRRRRAGRLASPATGDLDSDQGAQFPAAAISMDWPRARARQRPIERLWRTVEYELVYPGDFADGSALRAALAGYFPFYNEPKPDSRVTIIGTLSDFSEAGEDELENHPKWFKTNAARPV